MVSGISESVLTVGVKLVGVKLALNFLSISKTKSYEYTPQTEYTLKEISIKTEK